MIAQLLNNTLTAKETLDNEIGNGYDVKRSLTWNLLVNTGHMSEEAYYTLMTGTVRHMKRWRTEGTWYSSDHIVKGDTVFKIQVSISPKLMGEGYTVEFMSVKSDPADTTKDVAMSTSDWGLGDVMFTRSIATIKHDLMEGVINW